MKSNLTKSLLFIFANLLIITFANCQTWQWGLSGGGGSDDFGSSLANENVYKMGTDAKGNLYVAWVGFGGGTKIAGDTVIGANGNEDCMISKFTCNGNHLWTKVIGNDIFQDGFTGFGVDSLGNTYSQITGYDDGLFGFNIDTDTTFLVPNPSGGYRTRWWLVKYDSAGILQWYKAPESDTISANKGYGYDMFVMEDGTFYSLTYIRQNTTLNGNYFIPNKGFYLLKFDNQGNILNNSPIVTSLFAGDKLHVPKNQSRFYLSSSNFNDYRKDTVGTIPIQGHSAICAFDMQGNQLWVAQFPDTSNFNSSSFTANGGLRTSKVLSDEDGNIYYSCTGTVKTNNTITFGNATILNDTNKNASLISQWGAVEAIVKIDSNNLVKWVNHDFQVIYPSASTGFGIGKNKLYLSNPYILNLKKGSFNFYKFVISGQGVPNYYFTEIDKISGQFIKADSLVMINSNSNNYVGITDIIEDNKGQAYIGGQFPQDIVISGTTFNAIGGKTDMFIAKWGDTCGANLLSNEKLTLREPQISKLEVYPNPTKNIVNVSILGKVSNPEIIIYDMVGKKVYSEIPKSKFSSSINTSTLPSGLYNVILKSNGQLINSQKLVIED